MRFRTAKHFDAVPRMSYQRDVFSACLWIHKRYSDIQLIVAGSVLYPVDVWRIRKLVEDAPGP
jgi:hypothetical protein